MTLSALRFRMLLLALLPALVNGAATPRGNLTPPPTASALAAAPQSRVSAAHAYGKLPLFFERNEGQTDGRVSFLSRAGGFGLFLTSDNVVIKLQTAPGANARDPRGEAARAALMTMKLVGANRDWHWEGIDALPGKSNYFIGNDASKWRTDVPQFAKVRADRVYDGIDLYFYGNAQQLEYDLVVAPGADPRRIRLAFDGIDAATVNTDGDLVLETGHGVVTQRRPRLYQMSGDTRQPLEGGRYVVFAGGDVGIETGTYDASRPLVIDPILVYSTFLGGAGWDAPRAIAVDSTGSAYISGHTTSTDFPNVGSVQTNNNGGAFGDAFITKLSPDGTSIVYSTYLGGSDNEYRNSGASGGVGVDAAGNAYIAGDTQSTDFPVVNAAQSTFGGGFSDVFLAKLNAAGNSLLVSTYHGGNGTDTEGELAVDAAGNTYVTGDTRSTDFPTVNPFQGSATFTSTCCQSDIFLTKFDASGARVYSTYIGGNDDDRAMGIAVDSAGNMYLTGDTRSTNFPLQNPLYSQNSGFGDVFVLKMAAAGNSLSYSTLLGPGTGHGIAVDTAGNAYAAGAATASGFPVVNAFQSVPSFNSDAFLTKIRADGTALDFSTLLGGNSYEQASGVAVNGQGEASIVGHTQSTDFPTFDALQSSCASCFGLPDAFVTKFAASGTSLIYSTYLGGSGADEGKGIAIDSSGDAYVTGQTGSPDFPQFHALPPPTLGNGEGFVTKIGPNHPPVANAGSDQTLVAYHPVNPTTPFVLDGSASSDPDGHALSYEWKDATNIVVGSTATVSLTAAMGTHTFTLTVDDGHGDTDSDTVTITINADVTVPVVQVTRPNGGDKLYPGTPFTIEWTASDDGVLDAFDVAMSSDGGASFVDIPECMGINGSLRSCTWNAPGPLTSAGRVRVTARDGFSNSASDISDANFSVLTGTASITVTAPNTLVDWGVGSTQQIKWSHTLGASAYVNIEMSRDGGMSWSILQAGFKNTGGSSSTFNWLVTGPTTDGALIRVTWANGPSVSDVSDSEFIVPEPFIALAGPATTSTNWGYGTLRTQAWTTNLGSADRVDVLMSTDGGATYPITLAENIVATTKKATFNTPTLTTPTAMARIKVVWRQTAAVNAVNAVNFLVQPPYVRVRQPNGPQHPWAINASRTILWADNLGTSENVSIELSTDGGSTYTISVQGSTKSDGSQSVTVSPGWGTQTARIRVRWVRDTTINDVSNQTFVIQ